MFLLLTPMFSGPKRGAAALRNNAEGMRKEPRSVWGPLELLVSCFAIGR